MKEEKKTKKEQYGKREENIGNRERDDNVYEDNLRRLIYEVSKHKMILLTTRRTKENLERALEISKQKANDTFEDVDRLEGEVGKLKQEVAQAWKNRDNDLTKAHQTLTKLKELKSKMEKEQNNKGLDKEPMSTTEAEYTALSQEIMKIIPMMEHL